MVRLRLDLGYDGTDFSGWARQPGQRTVQGEIEQALGKILRLAEPPMLTVAGRTDAGVHARGQVAHVDVADDALAELDGNRAGTLGTDERLSALVRRLGGVLPPDVRVLRVTVAPEGFDARFSAHVHGGTPTGSATPPGASTRCGGRRSSGTPGARRGPLNAAAARLLGEHDFAAFCKKREGATTIRELQRLDWVRGRRGVLVATVVADAFCHSMVRALVGSLLAVGDGRRPVEWPGQVLARAVRDSGVHVAPAHGLCLEEVSYPRRRSSRREPRATRRVRTLSAGSADAALEDQ